MVSVGCFHLANGPHVFAAVSPKGPSCESLDLKLDCLPSFSQRSQAEEWGFQVFVQQSDGAGFPQHFAQFHGKPAFHVVADVEES